MVGVNTPTKSAKAARKELEMSLFTILKNLFTQSHYVHNSAGQVVGTAEKTSSSSYQVQTGSHSGNLVSTQNHTYQDTMSGKTYTKNPYSGGFHSTGSSSYGSKRTSSSYGSKNFGSPSHSSPYRPGGVKVYTPNWGRTGSSGRRK